MTERRRTIALCRPDTPGREIQHLAARYSLEVVYTVFTDTESSKLTAMIAVQHLIEHDAEVLVIPHLSAARISHDQHWRAVLAAADIITSDGLVEYPPPRPDRRTISSAS
jgi:sugar/nucleoside kinase (ribokinase family)